MLSLLGMLGICAYEDFKWKKIGLIPVLGFAAFGFLLHLLRMEISLSNILGGMSVGILLYILSVLSREKIGKGDALIVIVSGIYIGFWNNLILLWGAILLAGIVGAVYLIRGNRGKELPFIPFLLVVYIMILVFKGGTNVS